MIFVRCPRCGRTFGAEQPPEDGLARCPRCHQALRLREKTPDDAPPRRRRGPSRKLVLFVALSVLVGAGVLVARKVFRRPREGPAKTAPPPPAAAETVLEFQRHRARRAAHGTRRLEPPKLFARASPAVVSITALNARRERISQGSGFLVSPDGWVVTNYHVIRAASAATVRLEDGAELPAAGVGAVDPEGDLALLKVQGRRLPFLDVSDRLPPKIGTQVFAIGNPKGLKNTFSNGLISGHRREGLLDILQTTAPMSHGSSGGPLLTDRGMVVGVNARIRAGGQNLNFAIPAGRIFELLRQASEPEGLVSLADLGGTRIPKDATGRLDRAWAAMEEGEWEEARELLTRLARAHETSAEVWLALGHYNRRTGLYRSAVKAFEQALTLKDDYVEAHYGIGLTYLDQWQRQEILRDPFKSAEMAQRARQYLQKAADLDPAGRVGRLARAAIHKHWPKYNPDDKDA